MILKIIVCLLLILYLLWRRLDKYNPVDYGHKWLNRLLGLNQLVCRKYHRLGNDFWLDLPVDEGAVVAANHQSGMDPVVLLAASKRPIRFLTTSDYYDLPFAGYILKAAGCIPVYKHKDNTISLNKAIEALKNGEIIGIFPFGGIHLPSKPEPRMRSGVAVLSKLANVKIYPVYIAGVAKFSFNKVFTSMFFVRSRLKLLVNKPLSPLASADSERTADNNDYSKVLEQLYPLLSNHFNYEEKQLAVQPAVDIQDEAAQ